jgi:hypothetical protein
MKVEVFALCDAATENQGKLNILGTFDRLIAKQLPVVHPSCAVAIRLRFDTMEATAHQVRILMVDADGKAIFDGMNAAIHPRIPNELSSVAVNLIMHIQRLKFEAFVEYALHLEVDHQIVATLPLTVAQHPVVE